MHKWDRLGGKFLLLNYKTLTCITLANKFYVRKKDINNGLMKLVKEGKVPLKDYTEFIEKQNFSLYPSLLDFAQRKGFERVTQAFDKYGIKQFKQMHYEFKNQN